MSCFLTYIHTYIHLIRKGKISLLVIYSPIKEENKEENEKPKEQDEYYKY